MATPRQDIVGLRLAARYFRPRARLGEATLRWVLISRDNFTLITPMLHGVAAGTLIRGDSLNPLRRVLHHVKVVEAEVRGRLRQTERWACQGVPPYIRRPAPLLKYNAPKYLVADSCATRCLMAHESLEIRRVPLVRWRLIRKPG